MTLREYMKKRNVTQGQLSTAMEIPSVSQVGQWVRGVTTPRGNSAARLSAATKGEVTIAELLFPYGLPDGCEGAELGIIPPKSHNPMADLG